jgi:hypothetical protein
LLLAGLLRLQPVRLLVRLRAAQLAVLSAQ